MTRLFSMMSNGKGAKAAGTFITADQSSAVAQARDYQVEIGLTGTTANRPGLGDPDVVGYPAGGTFYKDTTLTKIIVADGLGNWRDPFTGAWCKSGRACAARGDFKRTEEGREITWLIQLRIYSAESRM